MRARIAFLNQTKIGNNRLAEIALRRYVFIVCIRLICPCDSIHHFHDRRVDDNLRSLLDVDWAHEARLTADSANRRLVRHAKRNRADRIQHLDLVDLMVAAHK